MKNRTTRITRVLVVLSLLAVVLTSVLIPSSASKAGTDPIFSGSDYGITFNDGVYTISIDAERLMEILTSKSFDKSTLLSIMPEKVYDLLVNRDAASAAALLPWWSMPASRIGKCASFALTGKPARISL